MKTNATQIAADAGSTDHTDGRSAAVMPTVRISPTAFTALPGWPEDDHARAFAAFLTSSPAIIERARQVDAAPVTRRLADVCRLAFARGRRTLPRSEARLFFERHFLPHSISHAEPGGLLTGYYEPVVAGSRVATSIFRVPLYRRPSDLVNFVDDSERARGDVAFTHMRDTPAGLAPFPTRAEIDAGALSGQGLEIAWLADPVDAFFAQVQGSLRVQMTDGTTVGLTYDGKNGHPYSSIGRLLIERGEMSAEAMSLDTLGAWLRADAVRGRATMQHNASYVFFRETDSAAGASALSVLGTPLVPGRSLAVDTAFHALGLPVFVDAPTLRHWGRRAPFRRLMVAHDVGSAIRGAERGDIYFGSGTRAGARAGTTKHPGNFHVLLPRHAGAPR